jgi:hypothetical protein
MSRRVLVFTAEIAVFDEEALSRAARVQARKDGLADEVWASLRAGTTDDLVMLLDPGSIADAGIEILHSTCEAV